MKELENQRKEIELEMECLHYLQMFLDRRYYDTEDDIAFHVFMEKFNLLPEVKKEEVIKLMVDLLRQKDVIKTPENSNNKVR